LDRSHFIGWDKLYGCAQTHQKSPKKEKIRTAQNRCNRLKSFEGSLRGTFSKVPLKKFRQNNIL
jgi:hypothetical protein